MPDPTRASQRARQNQNAYVLAYSPRYASTLRTQQILPDFDATFFMPKFKRDKISIKYILKSQLNIFFLVVRCNQKIYIFHMQYLIVQYASPINFLGSQGDNQAIHQQ